MIGLVTVVIAIVALSLLSPALRRPDVSDGAPRAAAAADPEGTDAGVTPAGGDADLVEVAPTAPGAQQGGQDDLSSLDRADTQPGDKPSVGGASTGLADPGAAPQAPGVEVNSDVPVAATSASQPPSSPQGDTQPVALANPAQPVVPDVSQAGSGFGTGSGVGATDDETAPQVTTSTDTVPSLGGAGAVAPPTGAEKTPDPATRPAAAPVQQSETVEAESVPVPQVEQAAPLEPAAPVDPEGSAAPQIGAPQIAALPQAGAEPEETSSGIGTRVVPLTDRNLSPEPEAQPDEALPEPVEGPPIKAYAAVFENPDNRPVMAIVLIDDDKAIGAEALAEFPYPLTFAVDPSADDAAAKMARHRAAGFEVVALVDLPGEATAQDAEVTLSVWLESLPQVVALLEGTGSGIQGNRNLSDQVTAIVQGSGLGLVMQARGLNTAYKLAARDGVATALVFRDFDGAGQSPDVMRRFLDQAAFRAGQQGGVIMLGRLRPDTISALLLWGLQDRASRVALAPVTAVLTRDQ